MESIEATEFKGLGTLEEPGQPRLYRNLRYPKLSIGKGVRFESGFFLTDISEQQEFIEQSNDFGLTIADITDLVRREFPLTDRKRIFLSAEPDLVLERRVEFHDGIFATEDAERIWLIDRSPLLRNGTIREIPKNLLQAVAEG